MPDASRTAADVDEHTGNPKRHRGEKSSREIVSSAPYVFGRCGVVCRLLLRRPTCLCERDSARPDDEDRHHPGAQPPLRKGLRVAVVPEPSPNDVLGQVGQNGR